MTLQLPIPSRPGLNGALFVKRSGTKKREWKTETGALKTKFKNYEHDKIYFGISQIAFSSGT